MAIDPSVDALRVGITLPQFRDTPAPALEVARRAEDVGLDGVFVFDHLWPMGQPARPALHSLSLLGALAVATERVTLGSLVARVGLLPDAVLVHALTTLARMLGPRLVAGLGTGDSANRDEHSAYGVPFAPRADRIAHLKSCCRKLRQEGVTTWVGGNSPEVRRVATEEADAWNGWGSDVATFARQAAEVGVPATWGGQVLLGASSEDVAAKMERDRPRPAVVSGTIDEVGAHLRMLAQGGADWVICSPLDVGRDPEAVELLAEAASRARDVEAGK